MPEIPTCDHELSLSKPRKGRKKYIPHPVSLGGVGGQTRGVRKRKEEKMIGQYDDGG